jgi:hypothetical protein
MASQWYYARNGQKYGPITSAQLTNLAKTGQLLPSDLIWKDGMPQWVAAGRSAQLFSQQQPSPLVGTPAPFESPVVVDVRSSTTHIRGSSQRRKRQRGLIISASVLTVCFLLIGSALLARSRSQAPPQSHRKQDARKDAGHVPNAGDVALPSDSDTSTLAEKANVQRDLSSVKNKIREIRPGMTDSEVLGLLGCTPDALLTIDQSLAGEPYHLSKNDGTEHEFYSSLRHAIHHAGTRMCWATGPLGITVHYQRQGEKQLRVVFVSDADSGYFLDAVTASQSK